MTEVRSVPRVPAGLVAHLGEIISVVAPDGTVLSVNQAPAERTAELPPTSALSWVHPDDEATVAAAFRELVADPTARTRTLVRVRRDDDPQYRHMETTGINRVADPEIGGLVFVSRDVEDRVQLERVAARSLEAQRLVADLGVRLLVEELDAVLDDALTRTTALLEASCLTLAERDDEGHLRVTAQRHPQPLPLGAHLPVGEAARERGVVASWEAPLEGPAGAFGVLLAGWSSPFEPDEVQRQLLQGVANVLAGARLRQQREDAAVVRALHDALTGLPTRPLLRDRLDHALARVSRGGGGLAVLMLDLDRFKQVNDRHGHAAGDAVLTRLGGDEFVVLCEDVEGNDDVHHLVQRLRGVFAEPFALPGGGRLALSGSVGAATSARDGHDPAALLHAADVAMYGDKRRRSG